VVAQTILKYSGISPQFSRAYTPDEAKLARKTLPQALKALGVDNFFINTPAMSFPEAINQGYGIGSPYSGKGGAHDFFDAMANEGFNGQTFLPQGYTPGNDPNPYRGSLYSRNIVEVDLYQLVDSPYWQELITHETIEKLIAEHKPTLNEQRFDYKAVFKVIDNALDEAYETFQTLPQDNPLAVDHATFIEKNNELLIRDALFFAMKKTHNNTHWREWPDKDKYLFSEDGNGWNPNGYDKDYVTKLTDEHQEFINTYLFKQFVVFTQHDQLRAWLKENHPDFSLVGDIQIGLSDNDEWVYNGLFMGEQYRLGAPPSQTGPTGQPWNFPVLDPKKISNGGKAFIKERLNFIAQRYDKLRFDHPHGWIDPWVYKHDSELYTVTDPLNQEDITNYNETYYPFVQKGSRLFATHDEVEHPHLKQYKIPDTEQIKTGEEHKPFYDEHVMTLTDDQVAQYNSSFGEVVDTVKSHGFQPKDLITEVLSTCPMPIFTIMEKVGLGRCRVIQKADPSPHNPEHVYRPENSRAQDWVLTSTHDSPSLWQKIHGWFKAEEDLANIEYDELVDHNEPNAAIIKERSNRAEYLAFLLESVKNSRDSLVSFFNNNPGNMAQGYLAAALASPARNIILPFVDVFGMADRINNPEEPSPLNWTLRLLPNYMQIFIHKLKTNDALNIPAAMAMALKRTDTEDKHTKLIDTLEKLAAIKRE
jgi:4-alpha-glucanotransferase